MQRKTKVFLSFFLLVSLVGLAGCPSGAIMRSPKITPKGKVQFQAQPGAIAVPTKSNSSGATENVVAPALDLAISYGINEYVDIQLHLNSMLYTGGGLGFQLLRTPFFDLSASFEIGGLYLGLGSQGGGGYLTLPMVFLGGLKLGSKFSINMGLGYQPFYVFAAANGNSSNGVAHTFVGIFGFDWQMTKMFRIRPQASVLTAPDSNNTGPIGAFMLNVGIGFIVDFG